MIIKDGKPVEEPEAVPIEKGVPIPADDRQFKRVSPVMVAARAMEIGDSVVIPASQGKQTAGNMGRATGFKFTQRREGDNIRIWRIK